MMANTRKLSKDWFKIKFITFWRSDTVPHLQEIWY